MIHELVTAGILGVVEGLTEFLPVSSTGHLILAAKLLKFEGDKAATFEIFIQLGAILAVVVLYFQRFKDFLKSGTSGGFSGLPGLCKLIAACIPAAAVGVLFHQTIKHYLFAPAPVACALIVGGLILVFFERGLGPPRVTELDQLTYGKALQLGLFQCFALWPGISRSGSMIVGGMVLGLSRPIAAEFSFLVAVPIMCMAAVYDLLKSRELLEAADFPIFAVGFVTSFVFAMLAIRVFIRLLQTTTLLPFGVYRIVLGIIVLLALS